MTGTTINATQYEALLHLFKTHNKAAVAVAHKFAQINGGWDKPSHDLSVLNSLSHEDMEIGLNDGWNVVSDEHLPLSTDDVPEHLAVTSEQLDAISKLLGVIHDTDALVAIHGVMLERDRWIGDNAILNSLSVADMQGIFSDDCTLDVAKPRPVVIQQYENGETMTQEQVTAIEDWFAEPENLKHDREAFLAMIQTGNLPGSLDVIRDKTAAEIMVALYVGVKII